MPRDGGRVGVSGRWPTATGFVPGAGGDVFGRSDGTSGAGGIGEPRITTFCGGGFASSDSGGRDGRDGRDGATGAAIATFAWSIASRP